MMTKVHTGSKIAPFWGRVAVLPSPVDQTERDSGLIIPLHHDGEGGDVLRGVVVELDRTYHEIIGQYRDYAQRIDTGTVIYYRDPLRVLDLDIVHMEDILAYEKE